MGSFYFNVLWFIGPAGTVSVKGHSRWLGDWSCNTRPSPQVSLTGFGRTRRRLLEQNGNVLKLRLASRTDNIVPSICSSSLRTMSWC